MILPLGLVWIITSKSALFVIEITIKMSQTTFGFGEKIKEGLKSRTSALVQVFMNLLKGLRAKNLRLKQWESLQNITRNVSM
jgi:hypothetical protein